jgi:hypothetical protein
MNTMRSIATGVLVVTAVAAYAQPAEPDFSKTANPELVGALAKELQATPQQAEGAAGALLNTAKQRLQPSDWSQVSAAVPGIEGLLKAAPMAGAAGTAGATGTAGAAASALGASAGGLGSAAAAFSKLGLKPDMVAKAVPILTQYVTKSGGAGVGSLLAGALK